MLAVHIGNPKAWYHFDWNLCMHCYCSGYSGIREQSNDPILLVVEFGSGFAHIPPVRGRVIELS